MCRCICFFYIYYFLFIMFSSHATIRSWTIIWPWRGGCVKWTPSSSCSSWTMTRRTATSTCRACRPRRTTRSPSRSRWSNSCWRSLTRAAVPARARPLHPLRPTNTKLYFLVIDFKFKCFFKFTRENLNFKWLLRIFLKLSQFSIL